MIIFSMDDKGNYVATEQFTERIMQHNDSLIDKFIALKKLEGCSHTTLRSYYDTMKQLSLHIGKRFEEMTVGDIRIFLSNYQIMRQIKNRTIDNMRRTYSSFFNYLEEEDIIIKNPIRKIHKIKSEISIQRPFDDEDIIKIQDACKTIRDRAMIDFLYSSGVRVSELSAMNITDICMETREGVVFGKGSKERVIYFDARTKVHLQIDLDKRIDNNPALFVTKKEPYERISKTGIEYVVSKIGMIAGVEKCHPHRFRRTLATRLIDRGVPIEQVQKILGHTKIDTTLIYAEVNQGNVKMNHSKFA